MPPVDTDEFFLHPRAVRRSFDAASGSYEGAAGVQREIRTRLLERLDIVRLQPQVVLDLGAGAGHAARALTQRYPRAQVLALDLSERMLKVAGRQQRLFRRFARVAADAQALPLKDSSIDLVFSNLMFEWCANPDAAFREIRRVLRPNGLFTFATLGPDTLKELRDAWRRVDARVHIHRFIDMHDLGDALMRASFAEPVMDTERLTVTYRDLRTLLRELQASGSSNIAHGRRRTLTGPRRWRAFEQHSEAGMREGVLSISVEVVYGHAWAGEMRPRARSSAEVRVPVETLKRRP